MSVCVYLTSRLLVGVLALTIRCLLPKLQYHLPLATFILRFDNMLFVVFHVVSFKIDSDLNDAVRFLGLKICLQIFLASQMNFLPRLKFRILCHFPKLLNLADFKLGLHQNMNDHHEILEDIIQAPNIIRFPITCKFYFHRDFFGF